MKQLGRDAASSTFGILVGISMFTVSFAVVVDTATRDASRPSPAAEAADLYSKSALLAELILGQAGQKWFVKPGTPPIDQACDEEGKFIGNDYFAPDYLVSKGRFGLAEEPCRTATFAKQTANALSYEKLQAIRDASDVATRDNGKVEYQEARKTLGLEGTGLEFNLRIHPVLETHQKAIQAGYEKPPRILYIGNWLPPCSTDATDKAEKEKKGVKDKLNEASPGAGDLVPDTPNAPATPTSTPAAPTSAVPTPTPVPTPPPTPNPQDVKQCGPDYYETYAEAGSSFELCTGNLPPDQQNNCVREDISPGGAGSKLSFTAHTTDWEVAMLRALFPGNNDAFDGDTPAAGYSNDGSFGVTNAYGIVDNRPQYSPTGDVIPDQPNPLKYWIEKLLSKPANQGNGREPDTTRYNTLIVGSDVSNGAMMTSDSAHHRVADYIFDWVKAGGRLIVLGSQSDLYWMEAPNDDEADLHGYPTVRLWKYSASGVVPSAPNANHHLLNVPHQISWQGYKTDWGQAWRFLDQGKNEFDIVIKGGTRAYLAISKDGVAKFGQGQIILTTWRPADLRDKYNNGCPEGADTNYSLMAASGSTPLACDPLKVFENLFAGQYARLSVTYGAKIPDDVLIGSETRQLTVHHPQYGQPMEVSATLTVWKSELDRILQDYEPPLDLECFPFSEPFNVQSVDHGTVKVVRFEIMDCNDNGQGRWMDKNAFINAAGSRPGIELMLDDFLYLDGTWSVDVQLTPPSDEEFPPGDHYGFYEDATQVIHWEIPDPTGTVTAQDRAWNKHGLWQVEVRFSSSEDGRGQFAVLGNACRHLDAC